jgi:APA family basic amino acid/polyamine antiporter
VFGAIACAFAGLCYAEMASTVPIAGSAYTYAYATLGEFIAWIIGWDLILEYALGATTVAIGWSGYVVSFLKGFGIVMPPAFAVAPFAYDAGDRVRHATGAIINLPAMVVVVGISALLVTGIRQSARVNNVIVAIKLVIVVLFIAVVASHVSTENWVTAGNPAGSFIPPNIGPGQFGIGGVVRGAAVVFFAYIGFDAVSTAAQEAKNPKRDMPIGILGSLVFCTILYVLFSYVLSGVATVQDFRSAGREASVAFAISKYMHGYEWLSRSVTVAILAGVVPAFRAQESSTETALARASATRVGGGLLERRIRAGLVVAQVAIAVTLQRCSPVVRIVLVHTPDIKQSGERLQDDPPLRNPRKRKRGSVPQPLVELSAVALFRTTTAG